MDNKSLYCGYIKDKSSKSPLSTKKTTFNFNRIIKNKNQIILGRNSLINFDNYCINASDCSIVALPYLCEVNCTNQEAKCASWINGNILAVLK